MITIEVVFTKSKKKFPIGSWLIRLWTRRSFSHVAVCFDTSKEYGTKTYYQASDGLVNYMAEDQFLKKHSIVESFTLVITEDQYKDIRNKCHREVGANYGFLQNVGIILSDITKFFGVKIKNPWKEGRNCSELLYDNILVYMGVDSYDKDLIKPHHIEKIIKEELSQEYLSF